MTPMTVYSDGPLFNTLSISQKKTLFTLLNNYVQFQCDLTDLCDEIKNLDGYYKFRLMYLDSDYFKISWQMGGDFFYYQINWDDILDGQFHSKVSSQLFRQLSRSSKPC